MPCAQPSLIVLAERHSHPCTTFINTLTDAWVQEVPVSSRSSGGAVLHCRRRWEVRSGPERMLQPAESRCVQSPRNQNGNQRTGTSRMCAVGQLIRSVQIEVVGQCSRKNIYLDSVDTIVKSHGLFPSYEPLEWSPLGNDHTTSYMCAMHLISHPNFPQMSPKTQILTGGTNSGKKGNTTFSGNFCRMIPNIC